MEEEKKKKSKNKNKKKNKQNKTTENVTGGSVDHGSAEEKNDIGQVSEPKPDWGLDKHRVDETECSVLMEAEKRNWLNKEANLEETIKQLQSEKQLYVLKEASFEETIKQLQSEKHLYMLKEASLEETIKQLESEKELYILKEASLEETIQQVQNAKELSIQKKVDLEMEIAQLKSEKDYWLLKESSLEKRIRHLLDENATLSLKADNLEKRNNQLLEETASFSSEKAYLDEKIKQLQIGQDSWALQESSTKESIASLNYDNSRLRMQVLEAEESRNKLLHENTLLLQNMNSLQSHIQELENTCSARSSTETTKALENEDLRSQIEASRSSIERLVTENAELVEKVNELYYKLDQQNVTTGLASEVGPEPVFNNVESATVADISHEPNEEVSVSTKIVSPEAISIQNGMINGNDLVYEYPPVTMNSSEIVEMPVDEIEIQDPEPESDNETDENESVPITDAPLIGAPFRFMSFVAKFVSGADLVNKS